MLSPTRTAIDYSTLATLRIDNTWRDQWFVLSEYQQPRIGHGHLPPVWLCQEEWEGSNWRVYIGRSQRIHWLGLGLDIASGILIVAVACAAFEMRRRRRYHLLQFRISDLLVMMLIVAVLGTWYSSAARQRAVVESFAIHARSTYRHECWAPQWLKRLIGTSSLKWFDVPYDVPSKELVTPVSSYITDNNWTAHAIHAKSRCALNIGIFASGASVTGRFSVARDG